MKNIALTLAMTVLLAACSSGSTVAPLPSTVNSQFAGNFQNINNTQRGTVRLDIVEDDSGAVTGNIIFESNTANCLGNNTVSGTTNGFNLSIASEINRTRFTIVTTTTRPTGATTVSTRFATSGTVGTQTRTGSDGTVTTTVTTSEDLTGNLNIQLAISNNGNTLSGTYVTTGNVCSNSTGSGDMTLNRI